MVDISESRTSLTDGLNFKSNEELGEKCHLWTDTNLNVVVHQLVICRNRSPVYLKDCVNQNLPLTCQAYCLSEYYEYISHIGTGYDLPTILFC